MVAKIAAFGRSTFSSLKRRNFRLYFIGQAVSQTGGWMQAVAQSWLVLHLTGSAGALGTVTALQFAPTLILGPYAGVLADRFPKRRMLYVTQSCAAALALALGVTSATGLVRAWMVYVMAGILGVVNAVDYPTRQSFLYELAGPVEVVSAVGLTSTAANLARVAGPAIAGILIASVGMPVCFFLNAVSFAAVLVCLGLMRPSEFHRAQPGVQTAEKGGLVEGFTYATRTPVVREALAMMAVVGVLTYEFSVTLPAFAKFALGGSAIALAWLMSSMGIGAAVGGLVTAGRKGDGLGRLSAAALLFGLSTAAVGLAPNLRVATALMFLVGLFAARFTGLSNGILQLRSAPELRSRVMALWSTAFLGSTCVGGPLLGWLAQSAGPRWSLGVGAIGGIVGAAIGAFGRVHARAAEPRPLAQRAAAEENAA